MERAISRATFMPPSLLKAWAIAMTLDSVSPTSAVATAKKRFSRMSIKWDILKPSAALTGKQI